MAAVQEHLRLAQSLPPRLLHLFKRWPPSTFAPPPAAQTIEIAENTSSADPNAPTTSTISAPTSSEDLPTRKKNPFLPFRNPTTGVWHGPHYSLRRQADLFKLAAQHNVLPLMPLSNKHPEIKEARRIEHGLRVQGTGEGKRVKGKHWERTLKQRLDLRRHAMEQMPDMIAVWKERGHGRGWKKFPRGKKGAGREEVFNPDMRHVWLHERAPSSV